MPLNPNPSDRETKTTMVTRVMLRVSSNQKDEVDAAFRYRIYRMAGVLSRKLSSPVESHRQALPEPDVNLSIHPAPVIQPLIP